ncbi:MAG: TOBE domain-containing protein, partial [Woeseiaceae bacterium]
DSCALRPEHVRVGRGESADKIAFEMLVTAYETNGNESFIHGQVTGSNWVVRRHGMHNVGVGTNIDLYASSEDVVRF